MMREIGHADRLLKGRPYCIRVLRNSQGKFYVKVNGIVRQKRLTANEIVGYLLNVLHMEIAE